MLRQAVLSTRCLRQQTTCGFSTTARVRKDFVQDMYLKELKGYKAPPAAKDAHVGVVKNYTPPSAPKAPELPSDLAGELSKYDATEPTLAESPKATSTSASEEEGLTGGAKEFLAFLEKDLPKPVHHH